MLNHKKYFTFHIKLELTVNKKPMDDLADPQLLPEPFADQGRSDLLGIHPNVALTGRDEKDFLRKLGERTRFSI